MKYPRNHYKINYIWSWLPIKIKLTFIIKLLYQKHLLWNIFSIFGLNTYAEISSAGVMFFKSIEIPWILRFKLILNDLICKGLNVNSI